MNRDSLNFVCNQRPDTVPPTRGIGYHFYRRLTLVLLSVMLLAAGARAVRAQQLLVVNPGLCSADAFLETWPSWSAVDEVTSTTFLGMSLAALQAYDVIDVRCVDANIASTAGRDLVADAVNAGVGLYSQRFSEDVSWVPGTVNAAPADTCDDVVIPAPALTHPIITLPDPDISAADLAPIGCALHGMFAGASGEYVTIAASGVSGNPVMLAGEGFGCGRVFLSSHHFHASTQLGAQRYIDSVSNWLVAANGMPTGNDADGDGIDDGCDNCPAVANPDQADCNHDGVGNVCETDADGDGISDGCDNCPADANPGQEDGDSDGIGNACDGCVGPGPDDTDGDGVCTLADNCPDDPNPGQQNVNGDAYGDACQPQGVLDNAGCYAAFDTVAPPDGNEPTFAFNDISGTGTAVSLSDDSVSAAIPIGFNFEFYGTTYSQAFISSNGFLTFLSGQSNGCCSGQPIPTTSSPNGMIAGRWTDLYPPGAGSVRHQTIGSAPARQFIVQFTSVPRCCGTSGQGTFQFILNEGSDEILVQYANADGSSTSAGIENAAGTIGLRWAGPSTVNLVNEAVLYSPTTDMTDDADGDSLRNCLDNCPLVANPGQEDTDSDGAGDACDCGDGIVAAIETCDDGNASAGDGCDASCQTESGYECTTPGSACTDIDECTLETDNCDTNATCTNSTGSFSCACNSGYEGSGVVCADINECDIETDNCGDDASCFNSPGAFFCLCNDGFIGNGITCDPAHYVGYKIRIPTKDTGGAEVDNKFPRGWVITVNDLHLNDADADDPENFEVKKAKSLLNPAQKNLEPAPDLNGLHYLRYQMKSAKESIAPPVSGELVKPPKHVKRVWQLQNQFGTINVESKKVSALLLPANKDLSSSPLPPDDANHYVCYQVKATKDLTDQTPESRPGSGVGKFRKDLQAFFEDQLDDCALDKEGNPSFPASPAAGKCLFDLKKVKELCNPMDKSAVESPRETSATITPSAATTQHSLLCYQPKLARKFTSTAAAALANAIVGDKIEPGQAKHTKRGVKPGNPLHTAPGNLFPNPVLVDTSNHELVCIPTDVASVAPATP